MDSQPQAKPVLSPKLLAELAEDNPFGCRVTPEEVEAWWHYTWPRYKTHHYRNHARAIRQWWGRARLEELSRARLYLETQHDEALREQEQRARTEDTELRALSGAAAAAIFGRMR